MKKLLSLLTAFVVLGCTAFAESPAPQYEYWYRDGDTLKTRPTTLNVSIGGSLVVGGITVTANLDMDGYDIIMDTDGDSKFVNDRDVGIGDDEIGINLNGAADFKFSANLFQALSGSSLESDILQSLANATTMTVNIPVTGADAGLHTAQWGVDSNYFLSGSATGNGAGGVGAVTTALGVAAGTTNINTLATFPTGQAITAGSYQIGRNADATNLMNFNVPTGSSYEFGVNDVPELILSATTLGLSGNTITGVGSDITGTQNTALTISVPDQAAGGLAGAGMLIKTDAAGAGGTGNNAGGMLWMYGGAKAGTAANGYVSIAPVGTTAVNYNSIMTPYSLWVYGYLEVNNSSRFNSTATFGSGFISNITTVPSELGYSGLYGGGEKTLAGKTVQTTDATVTDLATVAVAAKETYLIEARIVAAKSDDTDRAEYVLSGLFYRQNGGNVTQQGATTSLSTIESDATWDADLVADSVNQTIDVRVTGKAGTTIKWKAVLKYQKIAN